NHEHDVALDFQRREEGAVALAPVGHEYLSPGRRLDRLAKLVDGVGIGNEQLDRLHDAFGVEIELRLIERHIDNRSVVFRHADLEDGGNRVALHARVYTERRDVALGGDKRDL